MAWPEPTELARHFHNPAGGALEQGLAVGGGSKDGSVARKGHADGFCQAIHAIGCEHARTASACGAGQLLDLLKLLLSDLAARLLCARHEGVNQVDGFSVRRPSRLHRPARDEDRRNVDPHCPHEHPWHDLVAVWNTDHAIEHVSLDHRLYTVGDELTRGERVLHSRVSHRDSIIHTDGV